MNKEKITFGVHSDKDGNHRHRDRLSKKPLHKTLYGNNNIIGNAELLKKNSVGFSSTKYVEGNKMSFFVPARPILEPMLNDLIITGYVKKKIKNAIKSQMSFSNPYEFNKILNTIRKQFTSTKVMEFVKNKGEGYWDYDAQSSSPYTNAVKYLDRLDSSGKSIGNVYNKINRSKGTINKMNKWTFDFDEKSEPLIDSLDMLRSIDARVENKK